MVSPELLRRYPFFANLSHDNLVTLAKYADETSVDEGQYVFREGEIIEKFYLVVEGEMALVIEIPDHAVEQKVSDQLMGDIKTRGVSVSTLESGRIFGWSSLLAPYEASSSCKANTPCTVVAFNSVALRKIFAEECDFGYAMMEKVARVVRSRLHDLRTETLSYLAS